MDDGSGRERRFRGLYDEAFLDVTRFVERRVDSDAEDIVSGVFLTAWRRFDDAPADARPWLFVIAKNEIGNHRRSLFRRTNLDVRLSGEPPPGVTDQASLDRWIDLTRAWASLSSRDREVLALTAFDGLGPDAGATVLGIRRTTFSMRLARARKRLDTALGETHPHHPPLTTVSSPTEQELIAP